MNNGIIKKYNKPNYYELLENIKIINNTTNEEIAIVTFIDGVMNIKTKEPYRIYENFKKSGKENNNEIK